MSIFSSIFLWISEGFLDGFGGRRPSIRLAPADVFLQSAFLPQRRCFSKNATKHRAKILPKSIPEPSKNQRRNLTCFCIDFCPQNAASGTAFGSQNGYQNGFKIQSKIRQIFARIFRAPGKRAPGNPRLNAYPHIFRV